ncbi:MAG: chitobiase/beta-hexosaminidase C-terminal domain-containing protein [Spirochaetes bacterium]|nr:chitobiase/beta-hexosaminidase C-terminal domain-containing protein [Spirochaetota bacterium]
MVVLKKVKPNKLYLERLNKWRKLKGLKPVDNIVPAPFGKEINAEDYIIENNIKGFKSRDPVVKAGLPSYVDNSTLQYFPPIRTQGSIGSCACFSTTYYQMTHMVGLLRGWDNKNGDNNYKFSPRFTYNMVNGGSDSGSFPTDAYAIMLKHGCATWQQFPYFTSDAQATNYRQWCMDPAAWRSAISCRMDQSGSVLNLHTEEGLEQLKQLLANGYVLVYSTYVNSWQYTTIKNDPGTTADDAFVGKSVCHWVNGTAGAHSMTVVGYCDDIWVDVNDNNIIDAGEKGAFRIANSWGTGWGESGFRWFAYDAIKPVSGISNAPITNRREGWWSRKAYWITARNNYSPRYLAEFTLHHAKRSELLVRLGISFEDSAFPFTYWYPKALWYSGGEYAFDGTTTPVDATFYFDFTDIASEGARRLFLGVYDRTSGSSNIIKSYKFIYAPTNFTLVCNQVPRTNDNDDIWLYIEGDPTLPVTTATPDAGSYFETVDVTLTSVDDEYALEGLYYTLDGSDPKLSATAVAAASPATVSINSSCYLKYFARNILGLEEHTRSKKYTILKVPSESVGVYNTHCNLSRQEFIKIIMKEAGKYHVRIFSLSGNLVKDFGNRNYEAYTILEWRGEQDELSDHAGPGIYIVVIKNGDTVHRFKVMIIM